MIQAVGTNKTTSNKPKEALGQKKNLGAVPWEHLQILRGGHGGRARGLQRRGVEQIAGPAGFEQQYAALILGSFFMRNHLCIGQ